MYLITLNYLKFLFIELQPAFNISRSVNFIFFHVRLRLQHLHNALSIGYIWWYAVCPLQVSVVKKGCLWQKLVSPRLVCIYTERLYFIVDSRPIIYFAQCASYKTKTHSNSRLSACWTELGRAIWWWSRKCDTSIHFNKQIAFLFSRNDSNWTTT